MSGSGGFYKYRCKYFYTHNCTNWVYVNNSPCANCLAEGRDSVETPAQQPFKDIMVPYWDVNGMRQECLMEYVATDASGVYWSLRYKAPVQMGPTVTSDTPRPVYPPS